MNDPTCVLVLAGGAPWESTAVGRLSSVPGVVVLKRCVDVDDLLAAATSGQADVAVVGLDAPGLDASAVAHLRRHDVRPVAVLPPADRAGERATLLGIASTVPEIDLGGLAAAVTEGDSPADTLLTPGTGAHLDARAEPEPPVDGDGARRIVAVWGPAGAPGRTTVAVTLAAELAGRGHHTVLVDADPYGGSIAQQLGVLDEASGLLSSVRLAAGGQLADRFASTCRRVGDRLWVMTGLPRADRWSEVRPEAFEQVLSTAVEHGHVIVDCGFSLEDDAPDLSARPGRNTTTVTALDLADEVVVVGSADPVGLSRLARGLVELRERTGGRPVRVVVNRMRPSIGWSEKEIAGMVEGFARITGLHFVPDDQDATDRALVSGRSLVEVGESGPRRAVSRLADAVAPASASPEVGRRGRGPRRTSGRASARTSGRVRQRTAGRDRRR